ncbi:MAG: ferritin family protein [candidate division Zixibacteria bacterium]|nr:ferritin family protein [candidate division Zixibacteria bacterium]
MAVNSEILDALTTGIQSEVAAYVFYIEAIKLADMADFKTILEDLAIEEKKHFQILERQYDSLVRSEKWISTADVLKQDGLPEIDASMTEKHQALIESVGKLSTSLEIFNMALKLESDSQELFIKLAGSSESEEAKKVFEHLAGFEEGHVKLIQNLINNL